MIAQTKPASQRLALARPAFPLHVGYLGQIAWRMPVAGKANDCSNEIFRVCRKANELLVTCQSISKYTAKPLGTMAIQSHRQFHRTLQPILLHCFYSKGGEREWLPLRASSNKTRQGAPPATIARRAAARRQANTRARNTPSLYPTLRKYALER